MILWILKGLLFLSMGFTVLTLVAGVLNMAKGTKENSLRSNRMMQLRVFCQAFALVIFSLLLFLKSS